MSTHAAGPGLGGYARVGWGSRRGSNIFFVERNSLTLRCLGTYTFAPDQVVAIERLGSGWFDGGVRILHNRGDCPRRMSFYCAGGGDEVLRRLAAAGFVPCGTGATGRAPWHGMLRVLVGMLVLYGVTSVLFRFLH